MKRQIKTTLLNYLKLGMLSCMALPAYANNIPENLSHWQPGASTKNGDSNATFAMAVLTEEGENYGSLFKSEQSLNVVGDIRVAPEHVGKNGKVFIVAQYNNQWFMKGASGWTPWDLQTKNLVARSASHPLLEVESPVIENGLSNLLGDFEIFLGYLVDDDLNYNKTPLKFAVKVSEATKAADLTIKSFTASVSTLEPSGKTKLLVNIKNIGDALAPNTQLYYYKRASNSNEENSLNEGDKQECNQSLYQLPAGNSNDKYCQVDVPSTAGEYYYGVCVKTVEGEINLTNNCSSAIKITVKEPEVVTVPGLIAQAALTGLSTQTKDIGSGNYTLTAAGGSGSGAVSYSSGDTAVATVDSATGEVTLVAVGTATITATKAADSTYSAQTASYILTVESHPAPANVDASDGGLGTAKLNVSWNAVTGADSYNVNVYSDVSEMGFIATKEGITSTSTAIMGLINGLQYYVRVTAVINSIESDPSAQATATLSVLGMNDTAADAFNFTKLAANGVELSNQAVVWDQSGSEAADSQWSCVKDNTTGLVWEVKTDVGSADKVANIHHQSNLYTWGGTTAIGKDATTLFGNYTDDWNGLVSGSNADALCGFDSGWRVPTKSELASIANLDVTSSVAITIGYFPNTGAGAYWSSSPSVWDLGATSNTVGNGTKAWIVNFDDDGNEGAGDRVTQYRVRLVH